ncbi:O-antigen ligase family protein [Tissierella simiarum]|uniref:O-antigen ligase family protein n=1 Tax=Tissierella simiarum TaxID=2841534 RepID=UPI0031BA2252
MVEYFKRRELILPVGFGILFSLIYYKLPLNYFAVAMIGFIAVAMVLYDIRVGIFAGVFIVPFLPDMLNLLYMIFLVGVFFYKGLFKEINPLTKDSVDLPIILFGIVIILSTITSINITGSFRDLAIHLAGLGFLVVLINNIKTKEDFNKLVTIIVIAGTLVALYGLYQYVVGVEMEDKWLDTANNPGITTRVYSVFGNPNILAEYLIMLIPISVSLFWYSKRLHKKIIFLGTSFILMLTLILTLSRGGWVGFAFGMLVFVLLVEKRLLLSLIPLGLGAVYFLPPTILNRILSIKNLGDSSNAYRIKIWRITLDIIRDYWVAGVGFGYVPFKQTFESYIRTMPAYHAHNSYLEIAAEMGIPGLVVFLMFIFILYKYAIRKLVDGKDNYIRIMAAGVLSGIGGLLAHGAVENVLYLPKIIITFWTLVAFILALMRISDGSKEIS